MSIRFYLASSNPGKLRELSALAATAGIELMELPDYNQLPQAREDDSSFALNALEKALHYSRFSDAPVVADDSGLVVDALGGRPGVHSARYAGPGATDEDNNRKLLAELQGMPEDSRTARYICVLALAYKETILAIISDSCEGRILTKPCGTAGFGYDPLFFFPPLRKTFAEVRAAEKDLHSHRGKAFRKLLAYLRDRWPATSDPFD